jgi:hypothetical protein
MSNEDSHSVPRICRWHKVLWDMNRESLKAQMAEAGEKLSEAENSGEDRSVELVIPAIGAVLNDIVVE